MVSNSDWRLTIVLLSAFITGGVCSISSSLALTSGMVSLDRKSSVCASFASFEREEMFFESSEIDPRAVISRLPERKVI